MDQIMYQTNSINVSNKIYCEGTLHRGVHQYVKTLLQSPRGIFLNLHGESQSWQEALLMAQKFSDKTHFVHVGIGGSSLGPEMMIKALCSLNTAKNFTFMNNIDEVYMQEQIQNLIEIGLPNCVFFVVSKSGHTVETLAMFVALINVLKTHIADFQDKHLKDYFVVATDPTDNDLLLLAREFDLEQLYIPQMLGGRFSVLSCVGLFPCAFAKLSLSKIRASCESFTNSLTGIGDKSSEYLFQLAYDLFYHLEKEGINQTVLMPYNSKLQAFTQWFVQLWAESLGKKFSLDNKIVHTGLTPIASVGASDQHSQMQLFMEGPRDKFILFIEILNTQSKLTLQNSLPGKHFKNLNSIQLPALLSAELKGEMLALSEVNRPWGHLVLKELNESTLTTLILTFETLTVLMGHLLHINPFDQPGVELGKQMAIREISA